MSARIDVLMCLQLNTYNMFMILCMFLSSVMLYPVITLSSQRTGTEAIPSAVNSIFHFRLICHLSFLTTVQFEAA